MLVGWRQIQLTAASGVEIVCACLCVKYVYLSLMAFAMFFHVMDLKGFG